MKKCNGLLILSFIGFLGISLISCGGGGGGGNSGGDGNSGNTIISENTKILDQATIQKLTSISEDKSILIFSGPTPTLQSLSPGNVIVSDISPLIPNGLIRKVLSINESSNQLIIKTDPACLEDAIQKGSISISKTLNPSDVRSAVALRKGISLEKMGVRGDTLTGFYVEIEDEVIYDGDGNENTTNDQIKLNGGISFNPSFTFNMSIDNFRLKNLRFANTTTETAEIELVTEISILEIEKKVELARYYFSPLTVWVGWLPVVITPVLTVNVGFDGEVSVGITTSVTQETTVTAGVSYENGERGLIKEFSNNFEFAPPSPSAGAEAKAYASLQLNLLIYGVVGPYGEIKGYLEIIADLFSNPWWELYGGLEADVGVRIEVFSRMIADWEYPGAIGYRLSLARSDGPFGPSGTVKGNVKDAVTRSPLAAVTIGVYWQGTRITTGETDSSGAYSLSLLPKSGYLFEFSKPGYLPITYQNIAVDPNIDTYLEAILQIDTAHSGQGNVSGTVVNALNGQGVGNLSVNLRAGINVKSGSIIATAITNGSGGYSINNLNAGNYTAEVSGNGYNTTFFTVICIGGRTTSDQNATITPILAPGETRIILTWGEVPYDLDSHLTGPTPDGARFHTYFANKTYIYDGTTYADLDLDDIGSYGPETTTIYQQIAGIYRYSVHDYSNRGSGSSMELSNSGAQVRVYRGSDLVAVFNVPTNQGGTLWTVFELSGSTITPINTMSYESEPYVIQDISIRRAIETDAGLIKNLPPKR